jgi:hypothetical protein
MSESIGPIIDPEKRFYREGAKGAKNSKTK